MRTRFLLLAIATLFTCSSAWAAGADSLLTLARGAEREGELHRAVRYYSDAVQLDPSRPEPYEGLATVRMKLGDAREAERILTTALIHVPRHVEFLEARARVRKALGWNEAALSDMESFARNRDTRDAWLAYSQFCAEAGQLPSQLGTWRRLRRDARAMEGSLNRDAERWVKALQILVREADPVITPPFGEDPIRQALRSIALKKP